MNGKTWYKNRLKTYQWRTLARQCLSRDKWQCTICGEGIGLFRSLHAHHISYDRVGERSELEDLVAVCNVHHTLCHWDFLGFRKIPLTTKALTKRYRQLKSAHWRRFRPSNVINWIIENYGVEGKRGW